MKTKKNNPTKIAIRKGIRKLYKRVRLQKTISWRIISVITATISAWIITGSITTGLSIGVVDLIIKSALYYIHEKQWELVIKKNIKQIKQITYDKSKS